MGKTRKAASRKPLAPKDTNVPQPSEQQDLLHRLIDSNHREVERRIAAIRAVRDAEVEGILVQLRLAMSMLPDSVLDMPLGAFLKKFCPNTEAVRTENGFIELGKRIAGSDCPSTNSSFEFHRDHPAAAVQSSAQPTPRGFPFSSSSVKEQLLLSVDKHAQSEIQDEEFFKLLESFKVSKAWQIGAITPSTELKGQSKIGVTPRTERLPKRGEPLLSVNGSPLGLYGKDGITAIPEERPRNARRRLRASPTTSHL